MGGPWYNYLGGPYHFQSFRYVEDVLGRDELPADATMGRQLNDIVQTAASHMQTDKLDSLVKNSLRVSRLFTCDVSKLLLM